MDKEMEKSLIQAVPLARRGTPKEVANVYSFPGIGRSELCNRCALRGRWRDHDRKRTRGRSGAGKITQGAKR